MSVVRIWRRMTGRTMLHRGLTRSRRGLYNTLCVKSDPVNVTRNPHSPLPPPTYKGEIRLEHSAAFQYETACDTHEMF